MSPAVSNAVDRQRRTPARRASEMELPTPSLVVYLHRQANSCIASFSGALSIATQNTINGIAELIVGEISVLLDFSQVDMVDVNGVDATTMLTSISSVAWSHLQIIEPKRQESGSFLVQQGAICAADRICARGPTNQSARYGPAATELVSRGCGISIRPASRWSARLYTMRLRWPAWGHRSLRPVHGALGVSVSSGESAEVAQVSFLADFQR